MEQLLEVFEKVRKAQKYCLIWDKTGEMREFMRVEQTAHLVSLRSDVEELTSDERTAEYIRRHFIYAMRHGFTLCYDLEKMKVDFGGDLNFEGTFDADLFFNHHAMS